MDPTPRPREAPKELRRLSDRMAATREKHLVAAITLLATAVTGLTTALVAFRR